MNDDDDVLVSSWAVRAYFGPLLIAQAGSRSPIVGLGFFLSGPPAAYVILPPRSASCSAGSDRLDRANEPLATQATKPRAWTPTSYFFGGRPDGPAMILAGST